MKEKDSFIASYFETEFASATTSLDFQNPFECLCAILLSAQTTDASVNRVTPRLFKDYPTPEAMANAPLEDLKNHLRSLGLYQNKAKNLSMLSKILIEKYHGQVPSTKEELVTLPGVGNKTAGVFLLEQGLAPYFPVDTHVHRVAERLGYATKNMDPALVEKKLERTFPKEKWIFMHHAWIAFGRQICHARNPECQRCGLKDDCRYWKKYSSKIGK
jgi:endonuclease-3